MHELSDQGLDEVSAFLAVVDTGGFAPAARVLGRDASVVSRRVSALERRLGVRLLERTTRRVTPTEAGRRFADRARVALTLLADAEREAADAGAAPRGTLRLSLPEAFGRLWVAPLLPGFLTAFPHVRIEAFYSDRFVDLVGEGVDLAIRIGRLRDSSLVARKLGVERRLVCAAPSYLAARGTPRTPTDLAAHDGLLFALFDSPSDWHFGRGGERVQVRVSGPLLTDNAESLVHAVVAGTGVMLCSEWLVGRELTSGQLVRLLPDWAVGGEAAIHLVRPSGRFTAGKTRAFADWITARLSPPPWEASL
ncbi:LysR family transcriptional regulator [Azospirillum agricola]|uniref:LysR family transcriptional regulator n=1 Tax=Azospirillum agricola TaxID=1720247 RepID=UPI000A0F0187|nr:LysR family transcriptional regulator [Azospirillum agricola]SMH61557.1 transcriptional regulator, LysR family [Azospirillum lipoferum]